MENKHTGKIVIRLKVKDEIRLDRWVQANRAELPKTTFVSFESAAEFVAKELGFPDRTDQHGNTVCGLSVTTLKNALKEHSVSLTIDPGIAIKLPPNGDQTLERIQRQIDVLVANTTLSHDTRDRIRRIRDGLE